MKKSSIFLFLTAASVSISGQEINNTLNYRNIGNDSYARFLYENDYFTAADEYYTQGLYFEYVTPSFRKLFTHKLLWMPFQAVGKYGLAIQHNVYTPESIADNKIRYGDHPYAASLMLQSFAISVDTSRKQTITTTLSLGVMGHIGGGEWMQTSIHRATENIMPQGWQYQIGNDLVLNYRVQYEKTIFQWKNSLMVNGMAGVDIGTLSTKITTGGSVMLGYFNTPYGNGNKKWFTMYAYIHPQVHAVGYNAMLQGGIFNKTDPYIISSKDMNRLTLDNRYGIVIGLGRVYLEYFRYNIGKEFKTAVPHSWGGVQAGFQW